METDEGCLSVLTTEGMFHPNEDIVQIPKNIYIRTLVQLMIYYNSNDLLRTYTVTPVFSHQDFH